MYPYLYSICIVGLLDIFIYTASFSPMVLFGSVPTFFVHFALTLLTIYCVSLMMLCSGESFGMTHSSIYEGHSRSNDNQSITLIILLVLI